jgi:hypothetical protein
MGTHIDSIPQTVTSQTKRGIFGIDVPDLAAVVPTGTVFTVAITRTGFSRTEYSYTTTTGQTYIDPILQLISLIREAIPNSGVNIDLDNQTGLMAFFNEPTGPYPDDVFVFEVVSNFVLVAFEPEDIHWCVDSVNREPEPDTTQKDLGWVVGQKPPSQWFNWAWNNFTNSLTWVKKRLNQILSAGSDIIPNLSDVPGNTVSDALNETWNRDIDTPDLVNGAVTTSKIDEQAVTSSKIENEAVTGGKICIPFRWYRTGSSSYTSVPAGTARLTDNAYTAPGGYENIPSYVEILYEDLTTGTIYLVAAKTVTWNPSEPNKLVMNIDPTPNTGNVVVTYFYKGVA